MMAYNVVPFVNTNDEWSAANHNEYIRDNFAAGVPDIFTAAGDLAYGTGVDAAAVLAAGAAGLGLRMNAGGTAPEWAPLASLIAGRQGGEATHWSTYGTTNYTPAAGSILTQVGVARIVINNDNEGSIQVTFPVAFSYAPIVISGKSINTTVTVIDFGQSAPNAVHVTFTVRFSANVTTTVIVQWIAIGPA